MTVLVGVLGLLVGLLLGRFVFRKEVEVEVTCYVPITTEVPRVESSSIRRLRIHNYS